MRFVSQIVIVMCRWRSRCLQNLVLVA